MHRAHVGRQGSISGTEGLGRIRNCAQAGRKFLRGEGGALGPTLHLEVTRTGFGIRNVQNVTNLEQPVVEKTLRNAIRLHMSPFLNDQTVGLQSTVAAVIFPAVAVVPVTV